VFKLFTFVKQTLCSLKLKAKDEGQQKGRKTEKTAKTASKPNQIYVELKDNC